MFYATVRHPVRQKVCSSGILICMATRKLTLCWVTKIYNNWRYFPCWLESVGGSVQPRHGVVRVKGKDGKPVPVTYPEGRYVIRGYEDRRTVYYPVKSCNPRDAYVALKKAQIALAATQGPKNPLSRVSTAVDAYIKDLKDDKHFEAAEQAHLVLSEFVPLLKGLDYMKAINKEHVKTFRAKLRARELSDRTIANKLARLKSWLRFCKVPVDWMPASPKPEKGLPTIYNPDQLKAITEAADPYMRRVISLCLKLGLREQEAMYAEFSDVDLHLGEHLVQGKPAYKFVVKDKEARRVPVPSDLLAALKEWKATAKKGALILGTKTGKPNTHLLRTLKRLAKKAGLNCTVCDGCKGKLGECQEWTLHRFRRTYLTTLLRSGIDARTVQAYAGHSDITTTLKYLRPASTPEMRTKIDAVNWGD